MLIFPNPLAQYRAERSRKDEAGATSSIKKICLEELWGPPHHKNTVKESGVFVLTRSTNETQAAHILKLTGPFLPHLVSSLWEQESSSAPVPCRNTDCIAQLLLSCDTGHGVKSGLWDQRTQHRAFCLRQVTGNRRAGFQGALQDEGLYREAAGPAGGTEDEESPTPKFPPMEPVGGPPSCSFPIQWASGPAGERRHRNLNSYSGLHGDKHLYISAIWALEHLGKLDPKVIMCFRHSGGASEIKMIPGITFGRDKSWSTPWLTLYLDAGWSWLDYVKDLIWAVIKNSETQKKRLQGLKKQFCTKFKSNSPTCKLYADMQPCPTRQRHIYSLKWWCSGWLFFT